MITKTVLFALIIAFSIPGNAQEGSQEYDVYFPQQLDARDLLTACASSSLTATGRARQRYCQGFVSGVEEAARLISLQGLGKVQDPFCIPVDTSARMLANTFVRHASRPGMVLDQPSVSVVIEALVKAYPC